MDRQIVYPGGIPLDTDVLSMQRNILVGLGYLAQATLGTGVVADGLVCTPTQPASLSVTVGPGSITQFGAVDTTSFGSLPAEPAEPLLRMGVNVTGRSFTFAAPESSGQAINYLIEASFLEADATPVVLPYYNAADPAQPFSGPGNSGSPQNTQRLQSVQLQIKAGAPGAVGSQTTPPVDAGWVGLYVVTVDYGQTAIGNGSIVQVPGAPLIAYKLPQLSPGTHNLAVFTPTTDGVFVVPPGIGVVKLRIWGGGGAGGNGFGGAGGGGASGGYSEGYYGVAPGQSFAVLAGPGGTGAGSSGGLSSFGSLATATGGQAGQNGAAGVGGTGGATPGTASGSGFLVGGAAGGDALAVGSAWIGGHGGASHASAAAVAVIGPGSGSVSGHAGPGPGAGGGGGVGTGTGGQGGTGLILVEW